MLRFETKLWLVAVLDDPDVKAAAIARDRQSSERWWRIYAVNRRQWPVYNWIDEFVLDFLPFTEKDKAEQERSSVRGPEARAAELPRSALFMIVPSSLRRVALAAVACGLLISAARPICASDQEPSLRTELEMVYESYLRAVKNDDAPLLLSVLTEERITSLRRAFRDNGMKFPDQYFALFKRHSPTMPPLQGFRFVATTEGTKYANLIYTGDMKGYLRKAENEQRFLVIQFEKEKDGWKYSVVVDPPIDLVPNLESKLKEGDLSFLRFKPFAADRIELLP